MRSKVNHQAIEAILEESLPAIEGGQETVDSVLKRHPGLAEELRPALEAALWLRQRRGSLEPRPGFIHASRRWLTGQIRQENAAGTRRVRPSLWRRWVDTSPRSLAIEVAALILLIMVTFSVGNNLRLAAQLALPGDLLYPVKLSFEQIQVAFTFDEAEKTHLYTEFARHRTGEVIDLVLLGEYEQVPATAARLEAQIHQAIDSLEAVAESEPERAGALSASLEETLSAEAFVLQVLLAASPPEAAPGLEQALQITRYGLESVRY